MSVTEAQTVPCGIHTMAEPRTERWWLTSYPCGGTCVEVSVGDELRHYRCNTCSHQTARLLDGRPIPAWDGLLRDGSPYESSACHEHDWRL